MLRRRKRLKLCNRLKSGPAAQKLPQLKKLCNSNLKSAKKLKRTVVGPKTRKRTVGPKTFGPKKPKTFGLKLQLTSSNPSLLFFLFLCDAFSSPNFAKPFAALFVSFQLAYVNDMHYYYCGLRIENSLTSHFCLFSGIRECGEVKTPNFFRLNEFFLLFFR